MSAVADWRSVRLEELLVSTRDLTYGIVQPGSAVADGVPIVRVRDIRNGTVNISAPHRVGRAIESAYERSRLKGGELLVTLVGTVGETAVAGPELTGWNVARAVAVARIRPDVGARWVAWAMKMSASTGLIAQRVNTTVQTTLNLSDLRDVPIPMPPAAERQAIGALLGALDDKIESNRRVVGHSFELLDALAEAKCSSVPTTSLGSLSGLTRETVNPDTLGDAVVDHFSLPAFDASGRPESVPASTIMSNKIGLAGASVLVSRLNPRTDRTWWVVPTDTKALASTEFAVLSAPTEVELAAIWLAVRHPMFLEELPRRVTGTSGSHQRVRPDDMLAIEVPDVRRLDDATKRAAMSLLRLAHQHREESAKLSELRDTLLPELLSGRIRVPEAAAVVKDVTDEREGA